MELLKRYSISFGIAGLFLYFFIIWVEEKHENRIPHNLSTKSEEKVSVSLIPKRYHEKCVDLYPAKEFNYSFVSNALLSFNLHYHEDGEKRYIFKDDSIYKLDKIFIPEKRGYYCLMWGNSGSEELKIEYHFKKNN